MWYIVLIDALEGTDNETIEVTNYDAMTAPARETLLNKYCEIVGMLCAGYYEGATPEAAIEQAISDADAWIGGCVA